MVENHKSKISTEKEEQPTALAVYVEQPTALAVYVEPCQEIEVKQ